MASRTATPGVTGATNPSADGAAPKKSKKKLIIIIVVVLLVAAGAYYFLVASKASAKPAALLPGVTAPLATDPLTLNLSDGHFLKLQMAIMLTSTADVKTFDASQAADAAIQQFSDRPMTDMNTNKAREVLKADLLKTLQKIYLEKGVQSVYAIYITQFVMQ